MTILFLFLFVLLNSYIAHILVQKKIISQFSVGIISSISLVFLGLYSSVILFNAPLDISFVIILLLQAAYSIFNFQFFSLFLKNLTTSDSLFSLFLYLVGTYFVVTKGLTYWDEFSNWAYFAKVLSFYNGIPKKDYAGVYYDYMMYQTFLWSALNSFTKNFNLHLGAVLTWSVFYLCLTSVFKTKFTRIFSLLFILLFFTDEYFTSSYSDGLTSVGLCILSLASLKFLRQEIKLIEVALVSILLLFSKVNGLPLVAIMLIAIVLSTLLSKNKKEFSRLTPLISCLLIMSAGKFLLTKIFLSKLDIQSSWQMLGSMTQPFETPFFKTVFHSMVSQMNDYGSYTFLILIIFTFFLSFKYLNFEKILFSLLITIGYFLFLYICYLYVFGDYEGSQAASFARYIRHVYLTVLVILILELTPPFQNKFKINRFVKYSSVILLAIVLIQFKSEMFSLKTKNDFTPLKRLAEQCASVDEKHTSMVIVQGDSGFVHRVFRLFHFPSIVVDGWSFGPANFKGDVWSNPKIDSKEAFQKRITDLHVDQLILIRDNAFFKTLWPSTTSYPTSVGCISTKTLYQQ